MKAKFPGIFLFISASLFLIFVAACGPVTPAVIHTPTALATSTASPAAFLTDTPVVTPTCDGLCPSDSMTATAAMALTFTAIPSNTPPPGTTITPSVGDLGWGAVYGIIRDANTGLPIEGAMVSCEHFSYTPTYLCHGVTTTNNEGRYLFNEIFFHDTDRIVLVITAPGYTPLRFEQNFFSQPEFHADLGLFPETANDLTSTPTPFLMCTPPACEGGALVCGDPNGCPGGCGKVCILPTVTP